MWFIRTFQLKSQMGMSADKAAALNNELRNARSELSRLNERSESLALQLDSKIAELRELSKDNYEAVASVSMLRERNEALRERLDEQKKEVLEMQEHFKNEFQVLANNILEEKSKKFTEQNKLNLGLLLDPLGQKLQDFGKKVEDTYNTEMKERVTLQEQIRGLSELNKKMTDEANNLVRALKGDSKSQGNWGEVILERILERSGLRRDIEYRVQASLTGEDGRKQQPDVIIDLPEQKNVIVDSKVSITAYERFVSAEDDIERAAALKMHIQSIKNHIKGLSEKNYQNIYDISSPDFVLMFIPIEPAFALAFQQAPELYNEAFDKNIVIVSPTTLLATLATIASIWKQENRTKNAIEIARQGGALYDKFVGFVDDMKSIGDRLDKTKDLYNDAMNKLSTGKGNLVKRATELQKLGISTTKQLPPDLLEDTSSFIDE